MKGDDLYQKAREIWYFLYICVGATDMTYPPPGKGTKMPLLRKNASKGDISGITKKDDIHPKRYGIFAEIPD